MNIKNSEDMKALVRDSNNLVPETSLDIALQHVSLPDSSSEQNMYRYRFLLLANLVQRHFSSSRR
jgi:hypothetical protein